MYAIIEHGGKQYKVSPGDVVHVDYNESATMGANINFDSVLLCSDENSDIKVGAPTLANYSIAGVILAQTKGEKTRAFRYRRRKHSSKNLKGHRQKYTTVVVSAINNGSTALASIEAAALEGLKKRYIKA